MHDFAVTLAFGSQVVAGGALLLAALTKIRNPARFQRVIGRFWFIPDGAKPAVAKLVAPLEVLVGGLLLFGAPSPVAQFLFIAMLIAFSVATLVAFRGAATFDCGCLGSSEKPGTRLAFLLRNLSLGLVSATPFFTGGIVQPVGSVVRPEGAVLLAVVASVAVALYSLTSSRPKVLEEHAHSTPQPQSPGRRAFLGRSAAVLAALGAGTLLRRRTAEAACYGCTSCGYDYFWIACGSQCCAWFWVRPLEYCTSGCRPCGSWTQQQYCGYSQCC
ncbi:MAG TPA: MauE/DoxX family redox-associated membrane protein [Dehalococcoidia bacterium]|nr:MauE/DoxX family redox-associated membrane protein [Dehalococcoidia bacterium]